jgi:hypothetical protein
LNVHEVNNVRQTAIHTAQPFVPEPNFLEVGIAIAKLKKYKSPGSGRVVQAGAEILRIAV